MASKNKSDAEASGLFFALGRLCSKYWTFVVFFLAMGLYFLLKTLRPTLILNSGGTSSAASLNIESIGGWNVWVFVFFFLLSQSVIVHHLQQISKSLRPQRQRGNNEH